jgi:hypothetical protein
MSYFQRTQNYDPQIDKRQRISPIGGAAVDEYTRLTGTMFGAVIDANQWTAANSGAGSAAGVANGIATLSSGTANSGRGSIVTTNHGRFMFAHANMFRGAFRLQATTAALNTARVGAVDYTVPTVSNGFWFEFSPAGVLSVNAKAAGVAVSSIPSGSFNGEVTAYTLDTNIHAYEIVYFVMGAWFFIDGVLIHKFTPTTAVLTNDLDLHPFADTVNTAAGTTNRTVEFWSGSILRLGKATSVPYCRGITSATTTVCKIGSGRLHRIVVNDPTNNAITIYDNTAASGNIIATIDPGTITDPFALEYDCEFQLGLTVVTAGAANLTVVFD